jgi:hypothetical protein
MHQRFELRNSPWRNAVLFVLCLGLAMPALLLRTQDMWAGGAFFGLAALLFGYKTFDRRIKVVIDENGIRDFRSNRYGLVPWKDIRRFEFAQLKGNYYLHYFPRDPERFHRPSSKAGAWLDTKIPFRVVVSLQNMSVDVSELAAFMGKMIEAHDDVRHQAAVQMVES